MPSSKGLVLEVVDDLHSDKITDVAGRDHVTVDPSDRSDLAIRHVQ